MICLIDTSAFLAMLNPKDINHAAARAAWQELLDGDAILVVPSCVLTETFALVQARFGIAAARSLHELFYPILSVEWSNSADHEAAAEALLAAGRRDLSLVDCVSFHIMRRMGIRQVFTFDSHFAEQGFSCVPE
ncbi:MAG: PIN domain-containing protein [Planctomycetaceae bacterium]|nr:PIN domain-containing protein [Planctomycetaceae bacterium]